MPLRFFGGSRMAPGVLLSATRLLSEARQARDGSAVGHTVYRLTRSPYAARTSARNTLPAGGCLPCAAAALTILQTGTNPMPYPLPGLQHPNTDGCDCT
jgi:hypothetical protein